MREAGEPSGPLARLRVLELATGVAGPYAGRLLAMLGATVVKIEHPAGDPARTQWIDDLPPPAPSPLWVHLNAGKRIVSAGAAAIGDALGWADVVLDDRVRREAAGGPLDPERLAALVRRPVVARITAWGFDADDAGTIGDELLVQAASGLMAATGEEGREPLRFPGWQSQYLAGGYAAAAVLAALGDGASEVETTWVAAAANAVEAGLGAYLHVVSAPVPGERRQRALQDGAFPAGAFACADGHVVPGTVRPEDWQLQCGLYDRRDLVDDERFGRSTRWDHREELRREIQPWYEARTKRDIFEAALAAGWAAAMVMTAGDALADPHLAERRFVGRVIGAAEAELAGAPWRGGGVREQPTVRLEEPGESDEWFASVVREPQGGAVPAAPVRGVRVLELTWAWAGPFVGRFLGALGADVVRVETGRRPDGWRTRIRRRNVGAPVPDGLDPDDPTWDAAALFNTVNRNKRSVSIDLTADGGRDAFRRLLAAADVFVVNMTATVLADRGVEDDVRAAVERGLVAITLPALGATGPYRAMPGYGSLTEGMGGFAARFGYEDEGARNSTTYYPDAVAGLHASVAVLAGLARRGATGEGSFVDLSQQETLWLQLGEGLVLRSMTGREPGRMGNREPGAPESGLVPTGDGGWEAVVDGRTAPWMKWEDALADGTFAERGVIEEVEHPVTGRRTYLALPVRIDGRPLRTVRPAPMFDQHTDEVLASWGGLSAAEIAALRDANAIGTRPAVKRR